MTPVAPSDRDPKLVFIGIPVAGEALWDIPRTLAILENSENPYGWKFICRKVPDQGIGKARNLITYFARCTKASQLIMADSDVVFTDAHVFKLLSHAVDFVGAAYPKRQLPLCWVGEFREAMRPNYLTKMESLGTGFLRVSMKAVDQLVSVSKFYESDEDSPSQGLERGQIMHDIWGMGVLCQDWFKLGRTFPRYMTEDYYGSWAYRELCGGKLFLDPDCQVGHVGKIDYLRLFSWVEGQKELAVEEYKASRDAAV